MEGQLEVKRKSVNLRQPGVESGLIEVAAADPNKSAGNSLRLAPRIENYRYNINH
jgi:hypothetical protein